MSLDGAVVLSGPVVVVLAARSGRDVVPLAALVVAAANAASLAVPQGNPTNLVLVERLHLSETDYVRALALPTLAATLVVAVPWLVVAGRSAGRARLVRSWWRTFLPSALVAAVLAALLAGHLR